MKKVFFSMAGIALLAGSALAFTTARSNDPLPCEDPNVPENCIIETTPEDLEACCVEVLPGGAKKYFRLDEGN